MKFKVGDLVRVKAGICHNNMHCCYYSFIVLKPYEGKISFISEVNRWGQYVIASNRSILFDEDMLEKATMEMVKERYFPDYNITAPNQLIIDKYNSANDEAKSLLREIFKEVEEIQPKNIRKFPVLKKWKESSLIVLFNDEKSGTVVSGDSDWEIGISERSWVPYDDNRWEDFNGEVILKNK